ncbi:MAG: UDP-N-acetylglucosamine 1-carboxyvinyltransferase [Pseudomonadota bacterium]|nr:UDP-N-acetylglucosamine 1-carboxyvinyltransferase [Pseudomonadota bacterium]
MESIIISGGKCLSGTISTSGSKNSSLPLLALSILAENFELGNIPNLDDVNSMLNLLKSLGVNYKYKDESKKNVILFNSFEKLSSVAAYNLVRKMRASFLVLGPLLARNGFAKVSLPGGCAIGLRPVDLHVFAMKKLGADIELEDGYVIAKAKKGALIGNKIDFKRVSVGATENALIASVLAKGQTIITNAAREPEVEDLCNCLVAMGAKIDGIGTSSITIEGVNSLKKVRYNVISDRIEACSFVIAAAITRSELIINNVNPKHLTSFLCAMKTMGLNVRVLENKIQVLKSDILKPIELKTAAYPGFPTDMEAHFVALACLAKGNSKIQENIFENRFMHIPELNRLGANISIQDSQALISGNSTFIGAEVMATDLRASVSLVLAGLAAKGKTKINRVYHLDRGYEKIDQKLAACGANIFRMKNERI